MAVSAVKSTSVCPISKEYVQGLSTIYDGQILLAFLLMCLEKFGFHCIAQENPLVLMTPAKLLQ